jgi:NADH:ubiquinone oxidoreductase subunit 3 (subunit A)
MPETWPNGWDVYYIAALSAFLALGIPAGLRLVSKAIAPREAPRTSVSNADPYHEELLSTRQPAFLLGEKINSRFYLAANILLALLGLMLILIPCVGVLQEGASLKSVMSATVAIVTIAGFAGLGLLYSARKGDLNWLKSYQRK